MKKNSRFETLLLVLTYIELSKSAKARDLTEISGYSRTAMFRLLRLLKNDLGVVVNAVQGQGYVIADWGVLNKKVVVKRYEESVRAWTEQKSFQK